MSTLLQPSGWISFFTRAIGTGHMKDVGFEPLVTTGHGFISSVNEYLLPSITCLQITAIYLRVINAFHMGNLKQTGEPGRRRGTGIDTNPGTREEEVMTREDGEMIKVTVEGKGTTTSKKELKLTPPFHPMM